MLPTSLLLLLARLAGLRARYRSARSLSLVAALAVPSFVTAITTTASAEVSDSEVHARALYREGSAAFKRRDFRTAHRAWLEAWSLKKTYDVAGALAQVEIELGFHREAAEHLDYCLQNFPARESEGRLAQLRQRLQAVKAHVATLRLHVEPEAADVFVDGRPVGKGSPGTIYLQPGRHTIEARFQEQSVERVVHAAPGIEQNVQIEVVRGSRGRATVTPAAAAAVASSGADASSSPQAGEAVSASHSTRDSASEPRDGNREERSLVPVFVGAGVFAIGLAAGIVYRLQADAEQEDVHVFSERYGASGCVDGSATASECNDWKDSAQAVSRSRNISTGSFVVAGTAAAATAVYWWFWPRSANESGRGESARRARRGSVSLPSVAADVHDGRRVVWLTTNF